MLERKLSNVEGLFSEPGIGAEALHFTKPKSPNHRALSANKKVAVALYFLKDTASLRMTANSFGIALNTASAAVSEVCQAISNHLGPEYLHLPEDEESMGEKVAELESKFGMTQAFGCIDGTHIQLNAHKRTHKTFSPGNNSIH